MLMKRKNFMTTAGGGRFPRLARVMTLVALMLAMAGTGAWAEEQVVYTLDGTQTTSNTNYATAGVVEQGSITWYVTGNTNMNPWRIGGKNLSGVDRSVWSENWLDETVTKVTLEFGAASSITVNSITMMVAGDADFNNVIDTKAVNFSANNTVDVTPTEGKEWKDAYYLFVFNVTVSGSTNRFVQLKSIKFYNDPDAQQQGGGSTEPVAGTFTASLAEGTKDAANWSIASGGKSAKGDAADGLTGLSEGDQVTIQYTGRLKVKSVKATSDAAAAVTYTLLSAATTEDVGKVAGQDGYIYDNVEAATAAGTTASAIIAYVGTAGSVDASSSTYKGLAIALTDANSGGTCLWCSEIGNTCVSQTDAIATAITYTNGIASTNTLTIDGHTHAAATAASSYSTACPSGVSAWFLPSVGQWNLIVQGLATKQAGSTVSTNLTTSANNTYKSSNLNSVITDAGGTGFQSGGYWSSTEHTSGNAWRMIFSLGRAYNNSKTANNYVRAVFAF